MALDLNGLDPPLVDVSDAAPQLHQIGHLRIVRHFRHANDDSADLVEAQIAAESVLERRPSHSFNRPRENLPRPVLDVASKMPMSNTMPDRYALQWVCFREDA